MMRQSKSDRIFDITNYAVLTILLIIVAYPLYFVLISSISDIVYINNGKVWLWPKGTQFLAYQRVFQNEMILTGYLNSLFYAVSGTLLSIFVTMSAGYVLSRNGFVGKKFVMILMTITMYFGGGLIPYYFLIKSLHMINTVWIMIIPAAVSVYNIIVARTFIQSNIPDELYEAAVMDGASHTFFLFKIVYPLSKSLIAVIALFVAVGQWNSYFNALVFISDQKLYPLQLILRDILVMNQINFGDMVDPDSQRTQQQMAEALKYALIVVASVPPLLMYPLLQKHFVKGMMIGSLKG